MSSQVIHGRRRWWVGLEIVLVALLIPGQGRTEEGAPAKSRLSVVAYLPAYRLDRFRPEALSALTDVILFSIEPTPTGELNTHRLPDEPVRRIRAQCRAAGCRLEVALGGWGQSRGFAPMALDPETRARFVKNLTDYCGRLQLDGIDYDWEHPANGREEAACAALLQETKAAFQPKKLLLTMAVADWQKIPAAGLQACDRVHLMSYDHDEPRHSTLTGAEADVNTLVKKGAPRDRLFLGVPFYGRAEANHNSELTYAQIVSRYHPKPSEDEAGGYYFNGPETIARKAELARKEGLGGVMIWELGQDTPDGALLDALHPAAR